MLSWDNYYKNETAELGLEGTNSTGAHDADDLPSWFDDVGAPQKMIEYLTSEVFPLSTANNEEAKPTVLDLGTGNGSLLFQLADHPEHPYTGYMTGIDYSEKSIELAEKLKAEYTEQGHAICSEIEFEVFDIINGDPRRIMEDQHLLEGFDLVLDKGTFDAISLSGENTGEGVEAGKKVFEVYPSRVERLMRRGGYLLITTCNWTEDELIDWFTRTRNLEGFSKLKYPKYTFGGAEGQGVATVCFKKIK